VKNIDFEKIPLHFPPQCSAGGPYTAEGGGVITTVPLDGSASIDPNGSSLTFSWSTDCPAAIFDDLSSPTPTLLLDSSKVPENCNVRLIVSDSFGLTSTCETTVTLKDTLPPEIGAINATPSVIWPPNNKQVDVFVDYATTDKSEVACKLSVTSNEPTSGVGHGSTSPDWEIVDSHHLRLRAKRLGAGSGRIYTITVTCTDSSGNSSSKDVTVTVPQGQGK